MNDAKPTCGWNEAKPYQPPEDYESHQANRNNMNARNKTVDTTYLSIDQAEARGFIHRDYIAHCLRWSHVCKRLYERNSYRTARVLDIGCGRELPMAKMLYSSKLIPASYIGVDAGPINDEDYALLKGDMGARSEVFEKTNFLSMVPADVENSIGQRPNLVTCFEVLEHVEPQMMFDMLEHMKTLTSDDATFFISTPNWNRKDCAANHVNEMLYEALGSGFERHGFHVSHVYGTFASIRDYEGQLRMSDKELFDRLRAYYDTNFLSCIFAPLFPEHSRNALWELRKQRTEDRNVFDDINNIPEPWSSSEKWKDMSL